MKHSRTLNVPENSMSLEHDGGEYNILLPGKKKKERYQLNMKNQPQLSKSQRKLKNIEEQKEKKTLLLKHIETLENCKLNENVYSLMWSSRNLGQVEFVREKRRREVAFSKVGLELLHDEKQTIRKRKKNKVSQNIDIDVDEDKMYSDTDMQSTHYEPHTFSDGKGGISAELVLNENTRPSLPQFEKVENVEVKMYSDTETQSSHDESHTFSDGEGGLSALPEFEEKFTPSHIKETIKTEDASINYNHGHENNQSKCTTKQNPVPPFRVHILRSEKVQHDRMLLPICEMEQEVTEAIDENMSVIICGKTGCGKTTQVPQFLLEAGFGSPHSITRSGIIGVTQPRRVAVLATAKRVAFELGFELGDKVGYQVRHDKEVGEGCSIKFMTDGILLREVQEDFLLKRYSVLILDEAHERSLNTDILIGMLSRVIQQREEEYERQQKIILRGGICTKRIYPLKLVLMSATLRVEDFVSNSKFFHNPPPVIEVSARQYPVTTHFSKKTEIVDYVGQALKKVLSIHKRLPPGGILVFVTGQREVEFLCQKLRRASTKLGERIAKGNDEASSISEEKSPKENDMEEISKAFEFKQNSGHEITERFNSHMEEDHEIFSDDESDVSYHSGEESDLELFSDAENQSKPEPEGNFSNIFGAEETLANAKVQDASQTPEGGTKQNDKDKVFSPGQLRVLPLYAMLPASSQLCVFEEARDGERLVVVATNVAETSLTIPGVRYVVDTGREKVKSYVSSNGMETYEIQWISKASAAQRAGRAGRTGPGHCYRLYSSAAFNNLFPDFSVAEISKVPADGVVLLLKSMRIEKVANFPFPTPPETDALIEAERCLKVLEALDENGRLTDLGRAMARYPMGPRHSRMLLTVIKTTPEGKKYLRPNMVLAYAVATAAALSLANPFVRHLEDKRNDTDDINHADSEGSKRVPGREENLRKKKLKQNAKVSRENFCNPTSDSLTVAFALQCFELSENPTEFCCKNALHYKTMEEMSKLRKQLLQLVFSSCKNDSQKDFSWAHGTIEDVESSWRVFSDKSPLMLKEEEILGQAICAGWADRVAKRIKGASLMSDGDRNTNAVRYQACMVKETVFLHRWSSTSKSAPEFLVYSELLQSKRPYIHGATSVKSTWLPQYARALCSFSAPIPEPKPYYDPLTDQVLSWMVPSFGPHLWQLPLHGLPIKDDLARVAAFSYSLLEGHVLPCLKAVRKYLASSPEMILKPEARGLSRVGNLLHEMNRKGRVIDSRAKLRELWEMNLRELFPEIEKWFQAGFDHFEQVWEEMLHEVVSDPKKRLSEKKV